MFPAQQLKREQSLASCFSRADASCHGISNTWFACGFPSSSLTWPASQSGLQRLAREVRSDGSYMFDVDVNQVPPGYSQFDAALSAHPICESSRWRPGCRGHTTPRSKLGYRVHRSRRRTSSPQGSFVANLEFRRIKWWRRSSKSQKLIPWPQSDAPVHVAGDAYSIPASLGGWFLSIQSVLEKAREDHELQIE